MLPGNVVHGELVDRMAEAVELAGEGRVRADPDGHECAERSCATRIDILAERVVAREILRDVLQIGQVVDELVYAVICVIWPLYGTEVQPLFDSAVPGA